MLTLVADVLIQNEAPESIDKLMCLIPQRLYEEDGQIPHQAVVKDITEDLVDQNSEYSQEKTFSSAMNDGIVTLTLVLPNPTDTVNDIEYSGVFQGGNNVLPFPDRPEGRVLLNQLMFGVAQIQLGTPIPPGQSRWFRLWMEPLTGPQEQRDHLAQALAYAQSKLSFSYNVSGPTKVRYDLRNHIANMLRVVKDLDNAGDRKGAMITDLQCLLQDLVFEGTQHADTEVVISDWRTRFFRGSMEPFSSMQVDGAVRVAGAQPNFIDVGGSLVESYYEWATGGLQIDTPPARTEQGYFTVRFATRYVPSAFRFAALFGALGFVLAILSLFLAFFGD